MKQMLTGLIPPGLTPTVQWRVLISAVLIFQVAYTHGFIPGVGFAEAGDVSQVKADLGSIKQSLDDQNVKLLQNEIFQIRVNQCAAISADSADAKSFWGKQLAEKRHAYVVLAKSEPLVPPCTEL